MGAPPNIAATDETSIPERSGSASSLCSNATAISHGSISSISRADQWNSFAPAS